MNPQTSRFARLQSTAFHLLLATVILAPLSFWSSQFFALDAVKTIVIGLLTMATLVTLLILALKEGEFRLPPTSIVWIGILMAASIIASAIGSGHFMKSFFGQGFEIGAGSFILTLMLASLATYMIVYRRTERVIIIYAGLVATFLVLWLFQLIRMIFGAGFASLGILNNITSTLLGSFYSLGMYAVLISIISLLAVRFLTLSKRMKIAYWVLFGLSALTILVVNAEFIYQAMFVVFLGLTIYLSSAHRAVSGQSGQSFFKRLAIVPLIVCVLALVLAWKGGVILRPVVGHINAGYAEVTLSWATTLDIISGELKQSPLLGAGPNRFALTYLANKPAAMNLTDVWSVEFNSGFGFIPTIFVTQGFVGGILWILFFVFFGIIGVKTLRGLIREEGSNLTVAESLRPYARFIIISSYTGAAFLWITAMIYTPSHVILYFAFLMTGIWLGASVSYGRFPAKNVVMIKEKRFSVVLPILEIILVVIFVLWAITYIKNAAALGYFGGGVRQLNDTSLAINQEKADGKFAIAVMLNPLDVYWQARAEAGIAITKNLLATITATTSAVESESIAKSASVIINKSLEYADNAIKSDEINYNNYVSQARVAEVAAVLRMPKGYETAVEAYTNAIRRNPQNPLIYLTLAKLQASQNQFDAAIQTIGAVLQIKNNYLDAVFLLSQIEAAKGNLPDAIVAAQFATQLNPQNPLLFFQLGLLQYTKGDYVQAVNTLTQAIKLQSNYSNAMYFLGLSQARLGKPAEALVIFEKLAQSNPDNKDVSVILSTLRAGKSLFVTPTTPAARPEKRSGLPIPVK